MDEQLNVMYARETKHLAFQYQVESFDTEGEGTALVLVLGHEDKSGTDTHKWFFSREAAAHLIATLLAAAELTDDEKRTLIQGLTGIVLPGNGRVGQS